MEYKSNLQEETLHLEKVIAKIERSLALLEKNQKDKAAELKELRQMYTSAAPEFYNDIPITEDLERLYRKMVHDYSIAREKPYFGKIQFDILQSGEFKSIYIGKYSVYDYEKSGNLLVVDWRAPVSELYYNTNLGRSGYQAPSGYIETDLHLKTTFDISGGKILDLYDSEVIANDDLLIKYLSKNKDVVLNDIVATIQQDQNQIIRLSPYQNVIVQGVAGSGKTTVAIHRIAYLLYNYQRLLNAHNIYVIASSKLFLNYITSMLPDLDVPEINQGTLADFLAETVREYDPKFRCRMIPSPRPLSEQEIKICTAKVSDYFAQFEADFYEKEGFLEVFDFVVLNKGDIQLYLDAYREKKLLDRAELLDSSVSDRLRKLKESIIPYILDHKKEPEMQRLCREIFQLESIFESDLQQKYSKLVTKYRNFFMKKLKKLDYKAIFQEIRGELWPALPPLQLKKGDPLELTLEELCILLLIVHQMRQLPGAQNIRHIVIDEAQDFNLLVYSCLTTVFSQAKFTLVGDVMQNISENGLHSWEEVTRSAFRGEVDFRTLAKSYRNTIQISQFARNLVEKYAASPLYIEPVIRQGKPVQFYSYREEEERIDQIGEILESLKREDYRVKAVICKEESEADRLFQQLEQRGADVARLTPEQENLQEGTCVLSLKDSKGLEFDCVILADFDRFELEENAQDLKRAYVAITRALHELHVLTNQPEITAL